MDDLETTVVRPYYCGDTIYVAFGGKAVGAVLRLDGVDGDTYMRDESPITFRFDTPGPHTAQLVWDTDGANVQGDVLHFDVQEVTMGLAMFRAQQLEETLARVVGLPHPSL